MPIKMHDVINKAIKRLTTPSILVPEVNFNKLHLNDRFLPTYGASFLEQRISRQTSVKDLVTKLQDLPSAALAHVQFWDPTER